MTVEDITVEKLIEQLQKMPAKSKVRVWLPGSTIYLGSDLDGEGIKVNVFSRNGMVMIEGNLTPGSALERDFALDDCITILG